MGQGTGTRAGVIEQTGGKHYFYHDVEQDESLSATVITAIAELEGEDVTSLDFALHDHIDTDALDAIFAPSLDGTSRDSGRVRFSLLDYSISVHSDGRIIITDLSGSAST